MVAVMHGIANVLVDDALTMRGLHDETVQMRFFEMMPLLFGTEITRLFPFVLSKRA